MDVDESKKENIVMEVNLLERKKNFECNHFK